MLLTMNSSVLHIVIKRRSPCDSHKRRLAKFVAIGIASVFSVGVNAGFFSGNRLHEFCVGEANHSQNVCLAYVTSVIDTHEALQLAMFCASDIEVNAQARDIVLNWSKANPQFRSMSAANMVLVSLFEVFKPKVVWEQSLYFDDQGEPVSPQIFDHPTDKPGEWVTYCPEAEEACQAALLCRGFTL